MADARRIAIIGAGASGITAAIQLKQKLGIQAQIFELRSDFGGTWFANTYPGCACDVPSHLYSLSFEINPNWTKRYSSQEEIRQYFRNVAHKHRLEEQTMFNTEVVSATWLDAERKWKLDWRRGGPDASVQTTFFDIVFAGLGPLRIPRTTEQFKDFEGTLVHTANWDPTIDFTGKRVGLVGSGATAVQVIPELQKVAGSLHNYIRTPAWVLERKQYRYSRMMKFIFTYVPLVARLYRLYLYIMMEFFYVNFGYNNSFFSRLFKRGVIKSMEGRLKKSGRPDLVDKVVPKYPIGCKRITPSEMYLEALCKPNVTVDRSSIKEVRGRTVVTEDGNEHEFDILVLATGYDVQGFIGNLDIRGKNKRSLSEEWKDKFPDNYNSLTVNGYPNFFMLLGPTAILGHNSVLIMMEIQVDYAIKCIQYMNKKKVAAIEPTKEAQEEFLKKLKKDLDTTVWAQSCHSWYQNSKGEVTSVWSSTVTTFWRLMRRVNTSHYHITRA